MNTNELVKYVRRDPYLGKGTGSFVDKGFTDVELAQLIERVAVSLSIRGESVTGAKIVDVLSELEGSTAGVLGSDTSGVTFSGSGFSDPIAIAMAPQVHQVQQVQQQLVQAPVSSCRSCSTCR